MKRKLLFLYILLYGFVLYGSTESGVRWLETKVESNSLASNIARVAQTSDEAYKVLNNANSTLDKSILLANINSEQNTTETLSRKIQTVPSTTNTTDVLLQKLLTFQNEDGGFGEMEGYNSTILDTTYALQACKTLQYSGTRVERQISYLLSKQNSDGSWHDGKNEPSLYLTSLAMHSLWLYRNIFNLQDALSSAQTYILSQKNSNNLWDEPYLSALALLAITPMYADNTTLLPSIDALYATQNANGSWENDPYVTALILQAVTLASKKVPNPDLGSISGSVFDGNNGFALAGVNVNLIGANINMTLNTDNEGKFSFSALSNGEYTVSFSKNGFASVQTKITFNGTNIDLGAIVLNTSTSSTVSTIKGVVLDGITQRPIAKATVSIGSLKVVTNEKGEYYLSEIQPGTVTVMFEANGYLIDQKIIEL